MGLLRRRNRRSALADRRLMAQLLRGQLDRLAWPNMACARLLVFPKIFKAGLGPPGREFTFLGTTCPLGCARIRPGDAGRWISWNRIDGVRSAFRRGLNESGYVEISLHGLSPCGRGR